MLSEVSDAHSAVVQGEMQDALNVVKLAIECAEKEYNSASSQPLVGVTLTPLIAAPPKVCLSSGMGLGHGIILASCCRLVSHCS